MEYDMIVRISSVTAFDDNLTGEVQARLEVMLEPGCSEMFGSFAARFECRSVDPHRVIDELLTCFPGIGWRITVERGDWVTVIYAGPGAKPRNAS